MNDVLNWDDWPKVVEAVLRRARRPRKRRCVLHYQLPHGIWLRVSVSPIVTTIVLTALNSNMMPITGPEYLARCDRRTVTAKVRHYFDWAKNATVGRVERALKNMGTS